MANPYPRTIIDEVLGIEGKNIEYEVFEEDKRQGIKQVVERLAKHNLSPFALTIAEGSRQAPKRAVNIILDFIYAIYLWIMFAVSDDKVDY